MSDRVREYFVQCGVITRIMFQDLMPGAVIGPKDGQNFEYGWQDDFAEAYLITNVGRVRQHNEDCAVLCAPSDPDLLESHGALFAVADGMGGANAGEVASRMALCTLLEEYFQGPADQEIPSSLREAVQNANAKIYAHSQNHPECQGMGTTLSALVIKDNWAYIAQVGDSRVYLHRQGLGMRQLTRDHSYVAKQVRKGELSPEEAENHEMKNLITRSVGIKEKVKVDLFHLELQPNDTFLICSDGLCGLIQDDVISDCIKIRGVRTKTFTMVNKALEAGGFDNTTAVCVQIHKLAATIPAPQPTVFKPALQAHAPAPVQTPAPIQTPAPAQEKAPENKSGADSAFEGLEGLDDDFESFDSIHIDLESEHGVEEEEKPRRSGPYAIGDGKSKDKAPPILWVVIGVGVLLILVAMYWIFLAGNGGGNRVTPGVGVSTDTQAMPGAETLHPAIKIYENTGDYQRAMDEAKRLATQTGSAANLNAIEDLRKRFMAKIEVLLNKTPFAHQDQEEAARLLSEALAVDENAAIQELQVQVQQEIAAHKFMLLEVDTTAGVATFSINNPYYSSKQQRVKEGDMLQDRFRVDLITAQRVRLADTKISGPAGQRMLTAQIRMPVSNE